MLLETSSETRILDFDAGTSKFSDSTGTPRRKILFMSQPCTLTVNQSDILARAGEVEFSIVGPPSGAVVYGLLIDLRVTTSQNASNLHGLTQKLTDFPRAPVDAATATGSSHQRTTAGAANALTSPTEPVQR